MGKPATLRLPIQTPQGGLCPSRAANSSLQASLAAMVDSDQEENTVESISPIAQQWSQMHTSGTSAKEPAQSSETPPSGAQAVGQTQAVVAAAKSDPSKGSGKDQPDDQDLSEAIQDINDFMQNVQRTIEFKLDEDSGRVLVLIKDAETKEVVRQLPPEETLQIAKQLDQVKGLLFKEEA